MWCIINYWVFTERNCNINMANIDVMMKSEVVYPLNKCVPYLGAGWYYSGCEIHIHCKTSDVMSPPKNWSPLLPFPVLPSCVCCSFLHCLGLWSLSGINLTTEELRLVNLSQHLCFFFFFLKAWLKKKWKKKKKPTGKNTYNCILSLEPDLIITNSFTKGTPSNYRAVNPHSWCVGKN